MEELHVMSDAGRDALGYIGGGILALSLVPQIIKLVMTRSAADISLMWSLLYLIGTALSFVYLLLLGALAAWVPVALEVVGCAITITLKLIYDHTSYGKRQQLQLQQEQFQQWQLQYVESMKLAALEEEKGEEDQQAAGAATTTTSRQEDFTMIIQEPSGLARFSHPSADAGLSTLDISNHSKASSIALGQKAPKHPGTTATGASNNSGNSSTAGIRGTFMFGSPASAVAGAAIFNASMPGHTHSPRSPKPLPWYSQTGISHAAALPCSPTHCCHVCGAPRLADRGNSCNTSQSGSTVLSRALSNLLHSFTISRGSGGEGGAAAAAVGLSGAGSSNAGMDPLHQQATCQHGTAAAAAGTAPAHATASGTGSGSGPGAAGVGGSAAGVRAVHRLSLGASSTAV